MNKMATIWQMAIVPFLFPIVIFLFVAYSPGLLNIEPVYLNHQTPRPFNGSLEPNNKLDGAEYLLRNILQGPESIAILRGEIYTGLRNGWIVRIKTDGTVEQIVTLGIPKCETWEEEKCGRPLGMRFDKNGTLNVVDAHHGLYKVNIQTGSIKTVFDSSWLVDGKKPKIINDFDMIARSGDFYFSETSNKFAMKDSIFEVLEGAPNGRIIHHNFHSNITRTLVDGLAMPNGVQLAPRKEYLLFSESGRNRVMKYHLSGKKEGKLEVFIDNLPGFPDNIRTNREGGYWLPLFMANPPEKSDLLSRLRSYPTVRKVIARLISILRSTVIFIESFHPSECLKDFASKLGTVQYYSTMYTPYGLLLELNNKGKIIRSLHSPQGILSYISEVYSYGDALYLASPNNPFLAKLTM